LSRARGRRGLLGPFTVDGSALAKHFGSVGVESVGDGVLDVVDGDLDESAELVFRLLDQLGGYVDCVFSVQFDLFLSVVSVELDPLVSEFEEGVLVLA